MKHLHTGRLVIVIALALSVGAAVVWAFAEEPLLFRDPYTGAQTDEQVNSIHFDLTYAMALAAGFSVSDSIELQLWNQLVESEQIGPGDAVSYTNCAGSFAALPDANAACGDKKHANVIWPQWSSMQDASTCATSRFGPYSPFFHFPHRSGPLAGRDIGALHDWGWGITDTLVGYEAYAWGRPTEVTVFSASCRYTRTAVIDTGIPAGSLPAFATYLHSLADSYSHEDCIAVMDSMGLEWATHTTISVTACLYHPNNPQADDVHGREYYTYTDSARTDVAIQHLYREIVARSLQGEGRYYPLTLSTTLYNLTGTPTLSQALSVFVHTWTFTQTTERRTYADAIVNAVLAQRMPVSRVFLPVVSTHPASNAFAGAGWQPTRELFRR